MTIGLILSCGRSARATDAALEPISGFSPAGRALLRIRGAVPGLPVTMVCQDGEGADAWRRFCRHHAIPLHVSSADDAAERALEAAAEAQWEMAVAIEADQLFVDAIALAAAAAIIATGRFDLVTSHGNGCHPLGTHVSAFRVAAFQELKVGNRTDDLHGTLATLYSGEDDYLLPAPQGVRAAGLDLRPGSPEGAQIIRRVLDRSGPYPSDLPLERIVDLAGGQLPDTPWKGEAGPLMIAEIGGNHEGDFGTAKTMAESAIRSGADCVKFQLYTGASLVSPVESPVRHKHFQKFELEKWQHIHLAEMCREAGVAYVASVWDEEMLEWIDPYMDFYKVGSGDLTAWPLLRTLARRGKPILLSTGLATIEETLQTVTQIQQVDERFTRPEWLCLMQCTSMYPIPDRDSNLRVMDSFRKATGLAVGYSDHTTGSDALRVATAMGAEALEFHFTDSREGKEFRDHKVSLVEAEVRALKADLARITELRGSPIKVPQQSELTEQHEISFRRGVFLSHDAKAGDVVGAEDLVCLRPLHGTDARDADDIVGKTLLEDVGAFAAIVPGRHY